MGDNFRYEDIIVDSVQDDKDQNGNLYKKVQDYAGQTWKVKSGKEGLLKSKWGLLKSGAAIRLTIGKFKDWDYVEDLLSITDLAQAEQIRKFQTMTRDLKNEAIAEQVANKIIGDELSNKVAIPLDIVDSHWNWLRHANSNYAPEEVK